MNKFGQRGCITDEDFVIQVLMNFPEDYDVILNGLEYHLTATRDHECLPISFAKKMNHWYEKTKSKKEEKSEKKRPQETITNSISKGVVSVVSTAINLAIENVLNIKIKNMKK